MSGFVHLCVFFVYVNFMYFCVRLLVSCIFCSPIYVHMNLLEFSCVVVLTVYWCVRVMAATMADPLDQYNQTTVNLAALHVSPEPKTGH